MAVVLQMCGGAATLIYLLILVLTMPAGATSPQINSTTNGPLPKGAFFAVISAEVTSTAAPALVLNQTSYTRSQHTTSTAGRTSPTNNNSSSKSTAPTPAPTTLSSPPRDEKKTYRPHRFAAAASTPTPVIVIDPIHQHHQRVTPPQPRCEKLTDAQKYSKLESVGGRNQQFMANSPAEASRFFPRLIANTEDFRRDAAFITEPNFSDDAFEEVELNEGAVDVEYCDSRCKEIERKLSDALEKRPRHHHHHHQQQYQEEVDVPDPFEIAVEGGADTPLPRFDEAFDGGEAVKEGSPLPATASTPSTPSKDKDPTATKQELSAKPNGAGGRWKHCFLEKFIPVGNCTLHGEEDDKWGHEKLCTACAGVYVLNQQCFPSFINSVTCDKYDTHCIFDRFTGAAQGICQTKTLMFKVLRNRGDDQCEDWRVEYLSIPVACECYLSKSSWLEAIPPPEVRRH